MQDVKHVQRQIRGGYSGMTARPCWIGAYHGTPWELFKFPKAGENLFPFLLKSMPHPRSCPSLLHCLSFSTIPGVGKHQSHFCPCKEAGISWGWGQQQHLHWDRTGWGELLSSYPVAAVASPAEPSRVCSFPTPQQGRKQAEEWGWRRHLSWSKKEKGEGFSRSLGT